MGAIELGKAIVTDHTNKTYPGEGGGQDTIERGLIFDDRTVDVSCEDRVSATDTGTGARVDLVIRGTQRVDVPTNPPRSRVTNSSARAY